MDLLVASDAQGDEVLFGIVTEQTALSSMVNLQFTHRSAALATPPVSLQGSFAQSLVRQRIKAQPWTSRARKRHEDVRI